MPQGLKKRHTWNHPKKLGLMLTRGETDLALDYATGLYWKNRSTPK